MKKTLCILLSALMALSLLSCAAPETAVGSTTETAAEQTSAQTGEASEQTSAEYAPDTVIEFNDDVLESIVRAAMGKPEGDILVSDAQAMTKLELEMNGNDWSNPRINNIDALKYFTNLTNLSMGWSVQNKANYDADVDISPLAGMTKMELLKFACIPVSDISPLSGMVQLKTLVIMGADRLTDLTPLANCTQMEALELKTNAVIDLSPLSGMANLNYLDLSGNFIRDVSPLAGLTKLTTLYLGANPIKDYSPLAGIRPNMTGCDFEPDSAPQAINFQDAVLERKVREALNIPQGDITLEQTEAVTELNLGNEWQEKIPDDIKISNISALKYFPNLTRLNLQNNNIMRIDVLRVMPNMTDLNISNNNVSDIRPLTICGNLKVLNLNGCLCTSAELAPLEELTGLKSLDLSTSPNIKNVEVVAELTQLKALYMQNLPVDFTPIAALTDLTTLYLMQPIEGKYTPDYSVLKDIYPNLTDKNFKIPQG